MAYWLLSHISLINNIVSEDKPEILAEFDNSSSRETNASEIERFVGEKWLQLDSNPEPLSS